MDPGMMVWPLLMQLGWRSVVIVTDNATDLEAIQALLSPPQMHHVQHVLVSGTEALSGDWVRGLVKTGEESWIPIHLLLLCSRTCVHTALQQASHLEQQLGSQTAFGMTSRWLLVSRGHGLLTTREDVTNVTMDNVAVVDLLETGQLTAHSLMWTQRGRQWTQVESFSLDCGQWRGDNSSLATVSIPAASSVDATLFPNSRYGWNGRHFRVITKEWLAYVQSGKNEKGDKSWSGLLLDFLFLASRQLNFTFELLEPEDGQWGTGTSTDPHVGLYGQVIEKNVDLGLAPTDVLYDRSLLMDFTHPVAFSPTVLVYRQAPSLPDLFVLLSPLTVNILLALAAAALALTLVICMLETLTRSRTAGHHMALTSRTAMAMLLNSMEVVGGALVLKPTDRSMQSGSGRVLLCSWWLLSLVVAAAYSGTLTAYLSVSRHHPLFSSASDLVAKQHNYRWGMVGGTALQVLLQNSNDTTLQRLWRGMQDFAATDSEVMSSDVDALARKVSLDHFVLLQTERFARHLFGHQCHVHIVDAAIKQGLTALVLPKGSALTGPLSQLILRLHSQGVMSRWTEQWFPSASCPPAPPGPLSISLLHVQGVMLLLPLGLGLALVVLLLETLYTRRGR